MNSQQQRTPYNLPLGMPTPPLGTATGILDSNPNNSDPANAPIGEPLNDALLYSTDELIGTFEVTASHAPQAYLTHFYPYNVHSSVLTANIPPPRWLLLARSCIYLNAVPKITLQAVKVRTAPCKLIIEYHPDPTLLQLPDITTMDGLTQSKFLGTTNPASSQDTSIRTIKWEWDTSARDIFTVPLVGYQQGTSRITRTNFAATVSATGTKDHCCLPISFITSGVLIIRVAQPYQPGSLFPSAFQINVWKSFAEFNPSVYSLFSPAGVNQANGTVNSNYTI